MATAKKASTKTVTVQDREGNDVEVAVGLDGKNPVSINNPNPKTLTEDDQERQKEFLKEDLPVAAADNDSNA